MATGLALLFLPCLWLYFVFDVRNQNRLLIFLGILALFLIDWRLPAIHVASAGVIYACSKNRMDRKRYLYLGATSLVGALFYFRFRNYDFSFGRLLLAGALTSEDHEGLALAASISVMTLIMLGYLIEVHRKRIAPAKSFGEFLLFSSFFPISLVGPIERFAQLSPQLSQRRFLSWPRVAEGAFLISLGILKKLTLADPLSPLLNHLEISTDAVTGFGLWIYCFLGYVQIYAGFSGMIDVVRGISKILGIDVVKNFDRPYMATNLVSAWQRWNMSLIQWLREFVYIPAVLRTRNAYFSVMIVVLFAGLWHDISFRYVIWAAYWTILHWAYIFARTHRWLGLDSPAGRFLAAKPAFARTCTFTLIFLSTIPFMIIPGRVSLLDLLGRLFELRLSTFRSFLNKPYLGMSGFASVAICVALVFYLESLPRSVVESRGWRLAAVLLVMIFFAAAFGDLQSSGFVYLRY